MKTSLFILLSLCLGAAAAPRDLSADPELGDLLQTLSKMVQADTSNPPGNESRIVKLVAGRLKAEKIPYTIVDFAPGRQCIVSRLKGSGAQKPLLLLAHLDVVGTAGQRWTSPPHTVTEKDGYLVGRGVADDLGMAALELEEFIRIKRSAVPLRRDVIVALTADEESGGLGIRYLLEHKPELIDAGVAINEGGGPILGKDGRVELVALQSAEKTYQDFILSTKGTTGHSSVPMPDNAIYELSAALERLSRHKMPARLLPVSRLFFEKAATEQPPKMAAAMRALARAKGALPERALREVETDPTLCADLRTTCVVTMISAGTKENALPPSARANVNCRILPGESVASVRKELTSIVGDPKVTIEPVGEFGVAGSSPTDGEVPRAVAKVAAELWPGAPVAPFMSRGATDSRFLRLKGIAAYGINPIAMSEADERRMHGIDERIQKSSLGPAIEFLHRLILELARKPDTKTRA